MENLYTLEVCRKAGNPVAVVAIKSEILHGIWVFKSVPKAEYWLEEQRYDLSTCYGVTLTYDESGEIWDPGMLSALRAMLENNDIEIGENGKTYSRTMYPRGKQKTPRYIVTITDPMTRQTTKKIFDDEYIATRFRAECNRSGRPARMTRKMVEIQL